jgi:hypothetical protein
MAAATGTHSLRPRLTSTVGSSTVGSSTVGTSTFWTDTIGTSAVAADPAGAPVPLPGTPWSIRPAAGPAGRPAVEIYAAGSMLDVMVGPALAPRVLRGACSLAWAGQPCAVAWGFLPARPGLSVWFTHGPARSRRFAAPVSVIAGTFWVAPAEGRFRTVTVEHGGGRDHCRVRAARPC